MYVILKSSAQQFFRHIFSTCRTARERNLGGFKDIFHCSEETTDLKRWQFNFHRRSSLSILEPNHFQQRLCARQLRYFAFYFSCFGTVIYRAYQIGRKQSVNLKV